MAKRNNAAGESDGGQNELDFGGMESERSLAERNDELLPAGEGAAQAAPRRDGATARNGERAIPYAALPSLTLNPNWDMGPELSPGPGASMRSLRFRRIAALAAAVAFAAALGGLTGSALTSGFTTSSAKTAPSEPSTQVVLAQMQKEMASLRTAVEGAARDSQMKTTRIAERLDRAERAQAEPLAKLAKISETVERLERNSAQKTATIAAAASSNDVTGSTTPQRNSGPAISTPESKPANAQVLSGYKLHEVHNGMALIEGSEGVIEVIPGDTLPRLGRVEAIRKQDGRWMVVTSRGLIIDR